MFSFDQTETAILTGESGAVFVVEGDYRQYQHRETYRERQALPRHHRLTPFHTGGGRP